MTDATSEAIPTPYGPARRRMHVAEGIDFLETDGHGYVHLDSSLHVLMPAAWRETPYSRFGYYEEDCDWALVALRFPAAFLAFDLPPFDSAIGRQLPRGCARRRHRGDPALVSRLRPLLVEHPKPRPPFLSGGSVPTRPLRGDGSADLAERGVVAPTRASQRTATPSPVKARSGTPAR
jgi:hypothetical protein